MRSLTSEFLGCLSIRLEQTHYGCSIRLWFGKLWFGSSFEAFGFFFLSASAEVLEDSMLSIFS